MTTYDGNGVGVVRCCAKCVRGSRAFGQLPCGCPSCGCHKPQDAPRNDQDAVLGLVDGFDSSDPAETILPNTRTREVSDV